MEKEKQMIIDKKIEEKEMLKKTLKDNEKNRMKRQVEAEKERQDDIKSMEEFKRVLDRQEEERAEYFRKIERRSNDFISGVAGKVIKANNDKIKQEEELVAKYNAEKEQR